MEYELCQAAQARASSAGPQFASKAAATTGSTTNSGEEIGDSNMKSGNASSESLLMAAAISALGSLISSMTAFFVLVAVGGLASGDVLSVTLRNELGLLGV